MTSPQDDPLSKMYLQIGRFVVHCTELELVAYAAIHELEPNEETARALAAREFQPRVMALLTLSRAKASGPEWDAWVKVWQQVCSLIEDRKKILHNPVMFDVWANDVGEARIDPPRVRLFRKIAPQFKPLTFDFIEQAAEKAQRYSATVHELWSTLFPNASIVRLLQEDNE